MSHSIANRRIFSGGMQDRGDLTRLAARVSAFAGPRLSRLIVLILGSSVLEAAGLAMLAPLFSLITTHRPAFPMSTVFSRLGVHDPFSQIGLLLGAFVFVAICRTLILRARDLAALSLQLGYAEALQNRLVRALGKARWQDVERLSHARVLQALSGDMSRVGFALQLLMQAVLTGIIVATQWIVVMIIAPLVGALAVLIGLLCFGLFRNALRRSSEQGALISRGGLSMMHTAAQLLGGLKMAMAQNTQPAFVGECETVGAALRDRRYAFQLNQSAMRSVLTIVSTTLACGLLLAGVVLGTPAARLLAAFAVFARMSVGVNAFVQAAQQLSVNARTHSIVSDLIAELECGEAERRLSSRPASAIRDPGPGSDRAAAFVTVSDVFYANGGAHRLNGISLSVERGEALGIAGSSGAGKTTLLDVVSGLVLPDGGHVIIEDRTLTAQAAEAWRDRVAYVTQDSYLVHDSIRRNLMLGIARDLDDDALWEVLAQVDADELVRRMPDGLATVVSERGSRLSGGERQRLALARALLRRPELLVLDEATNAIDAVGEARVLTRLLARRPRITLMMVAHRPSTLDLCDRIVTLENGRVSQNRHQPVETPA